MSVNHGWQRWAIGTSLALSVFAATIAAETLSDKFQKKLDAADAAYQAAVQKAENTRFYAVQKATADRIKVLKQLMTEATKAGDLDAANKIKAMVTEAEAANVPDPSEAVHNRPLFLSAAYGVNQSWNDVTDKMNQLAQKKGPLKAKVTDEMFGDPAPTFEGGNTLVVRYFLNGKTTINAVYSGGEFSIP